MGTQGINDPGTHHRYTKTGLPHTGLFFYLSFTVIRSHGTHSCPDMEKRAIIFDLDGTLVDTVPLWGKAIAHMLSEAGVEITPEEFHKTYTPTGQLSIWLEKFHIDPARGEELRKIRDTYYIRLLREKARWFPGAQELLDTLCGTLPLGLVTGSWKSYVAAIDERLSVTHYFRAVITEEQMGAVGFPKPHPRGLLLAAEALGIAPSRCMYIGDMLSDSVCAKRAGMQSVIIRGVFTPPEALKHADHVFDSLQELPAFLEHTQ